MAPGMDEGRLLAEIERLLAREDPELDARMSALGRQLTGDPYDHAGPPADLPPDCPAVGPGPDGPVRRDWRKVAFLVAVVVAVVGLVLTAVLTQPADPGTDPAPPPAPPAGAPLQP
ncbi:DUF3040 domain-containing protein [Streptomyces sp. DH12]|uniref:DUF3040 domain-containing protein n=1 Tax=Streptomyces sp. DH12 TaxID=2857010 RepID=UPI001E36483B|nr:DUF3040 domain-containing protein [Streptomyces sp. DH12]